MKTQTITPELFGRAFLARLILLAAFVVLVASGCVAPEKAASPQPDPALAAALAGSICIAPGGQIAFPASDRLLAAADPVRELEERYGIRITLIGITAGGGMIDFRYKVIDADKATKWIKDAALMPHFENETSGVMLNHPGGMAHSPTLLPGRVYYMLYGNSGGALQPGDAVAVKFGDLSVGPVVAQ